MDTFAPACSTIDWDLRHIRRMIKHSRTHEDDPPMELLQHALEELKMDNDTVVRALAYTVAKNEELPLSAVKVKIAIAINYGNTSEIKVFKVPSGLLREHWGALVWFAKHNSDMGVNRASRYYLGSYMDDAWLPYRTHTKATTLDAIPAVLKYNVKYQNTQYTCDSIETQD